MNKFKEIRKLWRPGYVNEFEAQAGRFMSGLTFNGKNEELLNARKTGLIIYHPGPETRLTLGFPVTRVIPTGRESVFLEYRHIKKGSYHFVGSVDASKRFTFQKLERYSDTGSYHRVPIRQHEQVILRVTNILREIEPS